MNLHSKPGRSSLGRPHSSIERTFPLISMRDPALCAPNELPDSDKRIPAESLAVMTPDDVRRAVAYHAKLDLYHKYVKNTEDESVLAFEEGMVPVRFWFRCLTPAEEVKHGDRTLSLPDDASNEVRYRLALDVLAMTVVRVDNWPENQPPVKTDKGYVTRETLELLPEDHVLSLSSVISQFANLTEIEKKA